MIRLLITSLSVVLSLLFLNACASTGLTSTSNSAPALPENFSTNSVVVIIDDPRSERRKNAVVSTGYRTQVNYASDPLLAKKSQEIATDYSLNISYEWPIQSLDVHCFVIETTDAKETIELLNADKRVRYAQPLNTFLVRSSEFESKTYANGLNDKQDKLTSINLKQNIQSAYHEKMQYGKGQRIAVIDTSADINHPDLNRRNIKQWDFVGSRRGQTQERHGTAVLGLIAAQHDNGIGINGAAPKAEVGVFRACWQNQKDSNQASCDTVALSLALDASLRWKPDIVNLSLSGPPDFLLEEFIKKMVDSGIIVVTAHDDKRGELNRFPTKRSGVLFAYGSASNTENNANQISTQPAGISSNATVMLGQKDAFTLQPGGHYDVLTGHSMAAPIVSSLIALFKESMPNLETQKVIKEIKALEGEY